MDYEEEIAREILKAAHERTMDGAKHHRPFIQPLGSGSADKCWGRTFYRWELMDLLGIPVTRRWLRRQ